MHRKSITKIKNIFIIVSLILYMPFLQGCATITRGGGAFQDVSVNSDPQGANIVTNSGHKGVTPCVLTLEKNKIHVLEISKKGYKTIYSTVKKSVDDSSACNLLAGGIIGVGIDNATGAGYKLIPEKVDVKLIEDAGNS